MSPLIRALLFVCVFLLFTPSVTLAQDNVNTKNCQIENPEGDFLYEEDFSWDTSLDKMLSLFKKLILSEKRLKHRAYWDQNTHSIFLPYLTQRGGAVRIPPSFIQNIRNHIEISLERNYADAIFFADMGHSHFLIPSPKFDSQYDSIPVSQYSRMYEKFFSDPELKVVYHTAEQLKTIDRDADIPLADRYLGWRHHNRNVIGDNQTGKSVHTLPAFGSRANTLSEVPGYKWWSGGFSISANQKGCFSYTHRGQALYFDLSLFDVAPKPNF